LCRDTVTKVLECALEKHSNYNTNARKIIVKLNKMSHWQTLLHITYHSRWLV